MAGTLVSLLPMALQVWGNYQDRQSANTRLAAEHQLQRELAASARKQQNIALAVQASIAIAGLVVPLVVDWRQRRQLEAWQAQRHRLLANRDAEEGFRPALVVQAPAATGGWPHERESVRPPVDYPFAPGPGMLRRDLELLGEKARQTPLILLVPPPRQATERRWGPDLIDRICAHLAKYQNDGDAIVRKADRNFQWPNSLVYQEELGTRPTIIMEMTVDRERLDIRIGGCHLGPWPGCAPFPLRQDFPLHFPSLADWDQGKVDQINSTAPERGYGHFAIPNDGETLADVNHELAARVAALCAVAALDSHHIMATPAYDEQMDDAVLRAGVVADDWNWSKDYLGLLPLDYVADPAYHALNCCRRLLRRGQAKQAETELRQALALLAGQPRDETTGLGSLVRLAAETGWMHYKHRAKLRALLLEFDPSESLANLLDAVPEALAPKALLVDPNSRYRPDRDPREPL